MTTKQPPAQKHLERAEQLYNNLSARCEFAVEQIARCIAETESEALASKVEIPSVEIIKAKIKEVVTEWRSDNLPEDLIDSHTKCLIGGWNLFKDNLTLAPKEQTKECQCEELKQMIQQAQDNLKKNMELLTAPNEPEVKAQGFE